MASKVVPELWGNKLKNIYLCIVHFIFLKVLLMMIEFVHECRQEAKDKRPFEILACLEKEQLLARTNLD